MTSQNIKIDSQKKPKTTFNEFFGTKFLHIDFQICTSFVE